MHVKNTIQNLISPLVNYRAAFFASSVDVRYIWMLRVDEELGELGGRGAGGRANRDLLARGRLINRSLKKLGFRQKFRVSLKAHKAKSSHAFKNNCRCRGEPFA